MLPIWGWDVKRCFMQDCWLCELNKRTCMRMEVKFKLYLWTLVLTGSQQNNPPVFSFLGTCIWSPYNCCVQPAECASAQMRHITRFPNSKNGSGRDGWNFSWQTVLTLVEHLPKVADGAHKACPLYIQKRFPELPSEPQGAKNHRNPARKLEELTLHTY